MKWVLSLSLAFAFAGAATACPMKNQSAEADMTRIVALAAPLSTPIDPVITAATPTDERVVDASVKVAR